MTARPPDQPPTPTDAPSPTQASVDRATALTEQLIDRGAPWSSSASWQIVGGEAVVVGILGLLILFRPIGGSSTALLLVMLAVFWRPMQRALEQPAMTATPETASALAYQQ